MPRATFYMTEQPCTKFRGFCPGLILVLSVLAWCSVPPPQPSRRATGTEPPLLARITGMGQISSLSNTSVGFSDSSTTQLLLFLIIKPVFEH